MCTDSDAETQTNNSTFRRCYCNLPSCVQTSYMCKSASGACFAQLSLGGATSARPGHAHIRYSCVEYLPSVTDRRACLVTAADAGRVSLRRRGLPTMAPTGTEVDQLDETICCATDMCNYYYFRSTGSNVDGAAGESNLYVLMLLIATVDVFKTKLFR